MMYLISKDSIQWDPSCSCGRTDNRTDMTKLLVVFCNFKNAPKNAEIFHFTASDTNFKGLNYQDIN